MFSGAALLGVALGFFVTFRRPPCGAVATGPAWHFGLRRCRLSINALSPPLAPDIEAPAEMLFCLPEEWVPDAADEPCAGRLHNLFTLRGAGCATRWSGAALSRLTASAARRCSTGCWR